MRLESTAQIWGICGNLGGGKTLSAVELSVKSMLSGYCVCTNIQLNVDELSSFLGADRSAKLYRPIDLDRESPESWPIGSLRGSGGSRRVLVIIDEVAEWFDQYSATSQKVRGFLSWLRQSSKRGQDVIFVVQRKEFLAKSLRILVSRWIWVEDLAVWRLPKFRFRVPFAGGYIMRYVSDRLGNSIQPIEFSKKETWGRFYTTAQLLSGQLGETYEVPSDAPAAASVPWAAWFLVILWAVSRL